MSLILTLNTGSSSVKFALYDSDGRTLLRGQIKSFPDSPVLHVRIPASSEAPLTGITSIDDAVAFIMERCGEVAGKAPIKAVGHRVVHGGTRFSGPAILDEEAKAEIERLSPLAPGHQPYSLAAIAAAEAHCPKAVQTASFDTSFHRTNPPHIQLYALPRHLLDQGIRRYGFHGLSYAYTAEVMAQRLASMDRPKIVAAHLGSGASLCAMEGGSSIATSMGFTALDGLPMATRCGDLDPGVLLYLLQQGTSPEALEHTLYKESGLLGLSDRTGDMAALLGMEDIPEVQEAIAYYCHRVRAGIGEMAATLGGIDALVFSGGVGEHANTIRSRIADGLGWLDITLSAEANADHADCISAPDAQTEVHIVQTDEEEIIRRDAVDLLRNMD